MVEMMPLDPRFNRQLAQAVATTADVVWRSREDALHGDQDGPTFGPLSCDIAVTRWLRFYDAQCPASECRGI